MSDVARNADRIRAALAAELPAFDEGKVAALAERLVAAYSAPGRFYHGLDHIAALLDLFDTCAGGIGERRAVVLAILFHDAVYDPMRSDNEAASAALADTELRDLGVEAALIERVAALVRATAHGSAAIDPDDRACALLIDLDLGILAAEPAVYDAYAAAVRLEYGHVPDDAWQVGRARVLDHFLGQAELYTTTELARQWTERARRNLSRERDTLSGIGKG